MRQIAQAAAGVRFDVERQTAASINNVGGDQTFNISSPDGGRTATVGRWMGAVGLLFWLGGLGLLGLTIARTAQAVQAASPAEQPYTQYIASTWQPAVILFCVALVMSRYGRLLARR
jgi:hypothetical protein